MRKDYKDVKARYGADWAQAHRDRIDKIMGREPVKKVTLAPGYVHVNHVHISMNGGGVVPGTFFWQNTLTQIQSIYRLFGVEPGRPQRRMRTW